MVKRRKHVKHLKAKKGIWKLPPLVVVLLLSIGILTIIQISVTRIKAESDVCEPFCNQHDSGGNCIETIYRLCHRTPGNDVQLNFENLRSCENHSKNGHGKKTYDTRGSCIPSPTAAPTLTLTPTLTPVPTGTEIPTPTSPPGSGCYYNQCGPCGKCGGVSDCGYMTRCWYDGINWGCKFANECQPPPEPSPTLSAGCAYDQCGPCQRCGGVSGLDCGYLTRCWYDVIDWMCKFAPECMF